MRELIGDNGVDSSQIAWQLNLSVQTVEFHREHIKTKLSLKQLRNWFII